MENGEDETALKESENTMLYFSSESLFFLQYFTSCQVLPPSGILDISVRHSLIGVLVGEDYFGQNAFFVGLYQV